MRCAVTIALLAAVAQASASNLEGGAAVSANPVRKVITMLKRIQGKVTAEGEAEQKLYDKYMCFCQTGAGNLQASIDASDAKVPEVESAIAETTAKKAQLQSDLSSHQDDRAEAKTTLASATAIRENEAKAFAAVKAEADANIKAISGAVNALEKGMSGGFLQTSAAQLLRKLFKSQVAVPEMDRANVVEFLAGGTQDCESYAPSGGEITGILKQLGDQMSKNLAAASADEQAAAQTFKELASAKTKEVNALTAAIEEKTVRSGEAAISIAQMKNDLSDSAAALVDDKKFLADLDANCAQKKASWSEITKSRSDELVALAETIKLLQDDDALELFKKTLPSAASSFVQVETRAATFRRQAMAIIRGEQNKAGKPIRAQLDFIALALRGSRAGFEKVIKMVDNLIATLKVEQTDDDNKKEYCTTAFDAADDKKKGLERAIGDSEAAAASTEEGIATLVSEIKALQEGLAALDKSVADATSQRQSEHAEHTELMAGNSAAVELLGVAKNRLNKFYNPKLFVTPPKRELSEEDRIAVNNGGTAPPTPAPGGIAGTGIVAAALVQVSSHTNLVDAPPPAPESFGAYSKSGESSGVIAMIDLLVKDLEKEMTVGETEEKSAQAEYEQMQADAAAKRAADASALTDKSAAKANAEASLQAHADDKTSANDELTATNQYISSLHNDCDWLMQYFDMRKEARASEVDSLGKAKAVLSGADYSFLQRRTRSLRGNA